MERPLRQEELHFAEFLSNCNTKDLNAKLEDTLYSLEEEKDTFRKLVSFMVNSYACDVKGIVSAILEDKNATKCFLPLALHYVKQCACHYKPDYWDDRDYASVNACFKIVSLDSFNKIYESVCYDSYSPDAGSCPRRDTSKAVALIGSIRDMHSTNRQTFCNIVLSFLMAVYKCLQKEVLSLGILPSENVHFVIR